MIPASLAPMPPVIEDAAPRPRRRRGLPQGVAHRLAVLAYQQRHLAAGLCMVCPRPAVSAHYCEHHRRRINAQRRTRPGALRCGACHERGHNRRTCPTLKAQRELQ